MPVTEVVNHQKNRIEVVCSADPNHRDYRPLGYLDEAGNYRFPDGTLLPSSGGITYPDGTHRDGAKQLRVRPDGYIGQPDTEDAADPAGTARSHMHAVDARQQAEYDAERAPVDETAP